MTVWVFGDSFAYLHPHGDTWPRQVANKLNQELKCYAEGGTSLEYTYEQFNTVRHNINAHDTVILALTELNRRWFLRDRVTENIWMIMRNREDPKLSKALEYYLHYLDNSTVHETYLTNFLYNVEYVTTQRSLNTVILPCFETTSAYMSKLNLNLTVAKGQLVTVSMAEFDSKFDHTSYTAISDVRPNHLTRSNHNVLANKIVDSIKTKAPIMLNEGFVKYNMNIGNMQNDQFKLYELYGS